MSIRTARAHMGMLLSLALLATACGSTPSPSPLAPTPSPAITTPPPASAGPTPSAAAQSPAPPSPSATSGPATLSVGADVRVAGPSATEPVVATHPTDPSLIAVAYFRWTAAGSPIGPGIRLSRDGGRTWQEVSRYPWQGSGRAPGWHSALAWGPGPTEGSARLYWTAMTGRAAEQRLSVAYTDDEGATWSSLYVERRTRPWVGGVPDITIDRDPRSPGFGVVYVVYNWPADDTTGPGIHLLASADHGGSWRSLEIPKATPPRGFPAAWRIDARVRPAPDGSAYVVAFQADLRSWDSDDIFRRGPAGNVGRAGFSVTRVVFDRSSGSFSVGSTTMPVTLGLDPYAAYTAATPGTDDNVADPTWSMSLDVDRSTGRLLLAVGDYRARPTGSPRGVIRVGRSDDRGATWSWTAVPALPTIDGRVQSAYRPSLVALDGSVVLAMRGITDVPGGTSPARHLPTIGTYLALSSDGGTTFATPEPLELARWNAAALSPGTNGPGLRERAERLADGRIVYVWADGRLGGMPPDLVSGKAAIFSVVASVVPR